MDKFLFKLRLETPLNIADWFAYLTLTLLLVLLGDLFGVVIVGTVCVVLMYYWTKFSYHMEEK